ncbi:hypothetical protein niasHT_012511 [Heterodera trifolii]|uniref:Uncharacterized protein n=1 Tax=Heterodera trifolii TaxID=157864 RepID=A0ABD2LCI7_9BILA
MAIRSFLGPACCSPTGAAVLLLILGLANTVSLASIATGNGARLGIFRPTRSISYDGQQEETEYEVEPGFEKRSMTLGRLSFRPGKRWALPVSGAYAHDRQNRRYDLLLLSDKQPSYAKPSVVRHINFRLLPETGNEQENDLAEIGLRESAMGKRTAALGRVGFRPGKRSMAVGRTGFRPGKRSIATGRVGFRPGKRSNSPGGYYVTLGDAGQSLLL